MGNFIDLTGQRFEMLTVLERAPNDNSGGTRWRCLCDCGGATIVTSGNLRHRKQKSCGCLRHKEAWNHTHGESKYSRLYRIWTDMKTRCYNVNCKAYSSYGGRKVLICDEWKNSYESFKDWALANGYSDDLSIDRKDNDLGYAPDNCQWATQTTQGNNRRSNRIIVVGGEKMTAAQAARALGVDYHAYMKRLYRQEATA